MTTPQSRQHVPPHPSQAVVADDSRQMRKTPPSQDAVRRRAYEIYAEAGRPEGDSTRHWLLAEAQLAGTGRAPAGEVRHPI